MAISFSYSHHLPPDLRSIQGCRRTWLWLYYQTWQLVFPTLDGSILLNSLLLYERLVKRGQACLQVHRVPFASMVAHNTTLILQHMLWISFLVIIRIMPGIIFTSPNDNAWCKQWFRYQHVAQYETFFRVAGTALVRERCWGILTLWPVVLALQLLPMGWISTQACGLLSLTHVKCPWVRAGSTLMRLHRRWVKANSLDCCKMLVLQNPKVGASHIKSLRSQCPFPCCFQPNLNALSAF